MNKDFERKITSGIVLSAAAPTAFGLSTSSMVKAVGKVKEVCDSKGKLIEKWKDGDLIERYEYDGSNRLKYEYDVDGKYAGKIVNIYDAKGNLDTERKFDKSDTNIVTYEYDYDENGNLTEKDENGSLIEVYEDGKLIKELKYENNKLIKESKYEDDNLIETWKDGKLIEKCEYDVYGNYTGRTAYIYDAKGNLDTERKFDKSDTNIVTYEYGYDENGNLMKKWETISPIDDYRYDGNNNPINGFGYNN